ncbi:uncharacterized protein LOC132619581 [Lycium barbarum]|uniref:uncharacterized protein LOC132619581 n=1 Tax=Lycium barbarum TaxID=112863 RepID=UPI00293EC244|nr:uncharacterized protein LOC132619581 [Lycium barbarum]
MTRFSFGDEEFIEEEEKEFVNDVSKSILDDEEITEEEEFEVDISENSETRTRTEFAPSMDIDPQQPPHIPSGTIDEVDTYGYGDEEDEEINEEEEEENYNELVDHQDMSEYLETRTYYYDLVMDIDVNEGDPNVDNEEQEICVICLLEYKDENTIGTLQCGHKFHAECIKKWSQRKNSCPFCRASVLPLH